MPARSVQAEVLSREEIKSVLDDFRSNEEWSYLSFALWLGTGLWNAEVIGLSLDYVRFREKGLLKKTGAYPKLALTQLIPSACDRFFYHNRAMNIARKTN